MIGPQFGKMHVLYLSSFGPWINEFNSILPTKNPPFNIYLLLEYIINDVCFELIKHDAEYLFELFSISIGLLSSSNFISFVKLYFKFYQ